MHRPVPSGTLPSFVETQSMSPELQEQAWQRELRENRRLIPGRLRSAASARSSRYLAANSDSPKWRCTISLGSRMAVRLMRAFHLSNRSIYVDIARSRVSSSSMKGLSKCAMAAVSTHPNRKLVGQGLVHQTRIGRQRIQQLLRRTLEHRMYYVRRNLRQWL